MKVFLGRYPKHLSTLDIAKKIIFWEKKNIITDNTPLTNKLNDLLTYGFNYNNYKKYVDLDESFDNFMISIQTGVMIKNSDEEYYSLLKKFFNWYNSKIDRIEFVKIDNYDVYNLDYTLAKIILPSLKKIKEDKWFGTILVDNEDLPKNLQVTENQIIDWNNGTASKETETKISFHKTYIVDRMISAFENILNENDRPSTGNFKKDIEIDKFYDEEIAIGLKLFGKYYRALWT